MAGVSDNGATEASARGIGPDPPSTPATPVASAPFGNPLFRRIGRAALIGVAVPLFLMWFAAGVMLLKGGGIGGYFYAVYIALWQTDASRTFYVVAGVAAIWAFWKVK